MFLWSLQHSLLKRMIADCLALLRQGVPEQFFNVENGGQRILKLASKLCDILEDKDQHPRLPDFGGAVVFALHRFKAEESTILFRASLARASLSIQTS